jgi:CheY-like chemotaxis protein/PAS domain-containing protein
LADRPRVLVFTGSDTSADAALAGLEAHWQLVRARTLQEGLALLQVEHFDGLYVPAQAPRVWLRAGALLQHEAILEELGEGVAVMQPDLRIAWANAAFEKWCGNDCRDRIFYEALGTPTILGPDHAPLNTALQGKSTRTRLQCRNNQYLDLRIAPLADQAGKVRQLIALCRDVTAEVLQQQKLDALHQASRELASLNAEQLAEMSVEERIELLKQNIRRLTHDLLHYDVIEIRLLDPRSDELTPLLAEGMTPEAARRVLYARPEGNGVTGYVAATGKTYVCNDTASDPHYLQGAPGARSSLTVALLYGDKVIGTLNVESPQPGAFGPQDVQFTEIFCRELANALYTLDLLLIEKQATAAQSIEAINREVSLPVDEILNTATALLERWVGHEEGVADKLKKVLAAARSIKQSIQKVGEDLAPQVRPLALSSAEAPSRLALRVLVVDHDERVRRSAHSILGRLGCIVETARDGKEALAMARLSSYDVILADIRLPDLGGYETYRSLRQAQPGANVILMTGFGYDATHSIVKARQDGLRFVLYKPFRVDQLLAALQTTSPTPTEPVRVTTTTSASEGK